MTFWQWLAGVSSLAVFGLWYLLRVAESDKAYLTEVVKRFMEELESVGKMVNAYEAVLDHENIHNIRWQGETYRRAIEYDEVEDFATGEDEASSLTDLPSEWGLNDNEEQTDGKS